MSKIQVEVLESKIGVPALQVDIDDKKMMLHSKYNPVQEAERFIDSVKAKIEEAEHILFYGVGLGYHIRYFCEQYPEKLVSTYEPINEIANLCLKLQPRTVFPKEKLAHFLIEDKEGSLQANLQQLRELAHQKFIIITLPVYERLFPAITESFTQSFRNFLLMLGNDIATIAEFSRRWTVNTLMNLPHTLKDPNFLLHKKQFFKGKPALIVSAGPSLDDELENLRYIKENGLAYIFAVGSSNKTLLKHNIHPDAVVTYDPQQHNYKLFEEINSRGINSIPMIYGTTVGYETLNHYTGPKMYFVTSQDKLTQQFHKGKLPIIYDAPSVALIAMQLLNALEVSVIILVGQNFAFKKDRFYADGITRYDEGKRAIADNSIQEKDVATSFEIEDVHGGKVKTSSHFLQMKADMELYLQYVNMPVINTTSGGAAISGTEYKPLKQLIENKLKTPFVNDEWLDLSASKSLTKVNKAFMKEFQKEFNSFAQHDKVLKEYLIGFKDEVHKLKTNQIQKKLEYLDKLFKQYHQNVFYQMSIIQIAQRSFEKLKVEIQFINRISTLEEKAEKVIQVYMTYLSNCRSIYKDTAKIVSNYIIPSIGEFIDTKNYMIGSGIFQFDGKWNKNIPSKVQLPTDLTDEEKIVWYEREKLEDKIELPISFVETTQKGSKIHFRFRGEKVVIYGRNSSNDTLKLRVQIDQKSSTFIVNETLGEDIYDLFIRKEICTFTNLKNDMHNITIEVLSNNPSFLFQSIEIGKAGRAYHIHEVENMEELEIGKRIRCHYKATYNTVGEFSNLGEETSTLLMVESCPEPNGDFYFIMVDENKAIADRVIQNHISWDDLDKVLPKNGIDLPTCGFYTSPQYLYNDWDNFVKNDDLVWNFMGAPLTWGKEDCLSDSKTRKFAVTVRGDIKLNRPNSLEDNLYMDGAGSMHRLSSYGFRPVFYYNKIKKE